MGYWTTPQGAVLFRSGSPAPVVNSQPHPPDPAGPNRLDDLTDLIRTSGRSDPTSAPIPRSARADRARDRCTRHRGGADIRPGDQCAQLRGARAGNGDHLAVRHGGRIPDPLRRAARSRGLPRGLCGPRTPPRAGVAGQLAAPCHQPAPPGRRDGARHPAPRARRPGARRDGVQPAQRECPGVPGAVRLRREPAARATRRGAVRLRRLSRDGSAGIGRQHARHPRCARRAGAIGGRAHDRLPRRPQGRGYAGRPGRHGAAAQRELPERLARPELEPLEHANQGPWNAVHGAAHPAQLVPRHHSPVEAAPDPGAPRAQPGSVHRAARRGAAQGNRRDHLHRSHPERRARPLRDVRVRILQEHGGRDRPRPWSPLRRPRIARAGPILGEQGRHHRRWRPRARLHALPGPGPRLVAEAIRERLTPPEEPTR